MKIEQDDVTFRGSVQFLNLPKNPSSILKAISIPVVSNLSLVICSGSIINITNFKGGSEGQMLRVLGDGKTTIKNNTHIATSIAGDKLLIKDVIYTFTYIDSLQKWFESA